jgi:hypothetical protein
MFDAVAATLIARGYDGAARSDGDRPQRSRGTNEHMAKRMSEPAVEQIDPSDWSVLPRISHCVSSRAMATMITPQPTNRVA